MSNDQAPLLQSALALRRPLWLGEIALYENHVSISGWRWSGSVWHPLPFQDIRRVEKWPATHRGTNLVIRPAEARDYYCRVEEGVFFWVKEFRDDARTDLALQY